jgi:outer membrane receptor protein involved in Fe transport
MFKTMRARLTVATWLASAAIAGAQDIRGSITGRVTDSTGGVIVGAVVIVENVGKGVAATLTTNESGLYHALYLAPGTYRVTVESPGMRKAVRENVELNVEARITADFQLGAGLTEELQVIADQPILETATATSGVVVDAKTIEEMPLADGTAYFLARLAPGVEFTADPKFTRPMDNVNLAGVSASGFVRSTAAGENNSASSTEFMMDGAPNMISQNRLGFSPPAGAVQEFKVSTALYDAQYGQGGGGSVSLGLKSGTNSLRGELSYFNRDESRSANTFFANRLQMPKEARDYHRATMTLHGPIQKNKTFFLISGEYLFDDAPEPLLTTVPTEKMRRGDFSETNIVMYDPATSRRIPNPTGSGTTIVRDRFTGNIIPESRINPISRKVMEWFPLPNVPREQWRADLTGNYFTDRNRPYKYDGGIARVDHVVNDRNKLFVNVFRNWREEDRSNWSGTEFSQLFTYRTNTGGILGWTSTFGPTTVLDVRVNAHRFGDWGLPATEVRAADLGFNAAYVDLTRGYENIPRFDFETFQDFGRNATDIPFFTYGMLPTLTKLTGKHSLKAGYELRLIRERTTDLDDQAGSLVFRNGPTGAGSTNPGGGTFRDFSSFLLGVPREGDFDTNGSRDNQVWYQGAFIQDDWRATSKLTVNLGLRWEMEWGMKDRLNRNTRGFDFDTASPVEAAAKARFASDFAANPAMYQVTPGTFLTTPSTFAVRGGYLFASEEKRTFWDAKKLNFLPRVGATYKLFEKMVLRAGAGLYQIPYKLSGIDQRGFSRSTSLAATDAAGLPRLDIYDNPLGGNALLQPLGANQGLLASIGGDTGTIIADLNDREYQRRIVFQLGVQYRLPFNTLLETNYVASRGRKLITGQPLNELPAEYLIDSIVRDRPREDFFTGDVTNPFRGLPEFGTDDHRNDNIDREKLLRKYPHFENVTIQRHNGSNRYDSLQLRLEKRFSKGFMLSANYTYARLLEKTTYFDDSDTEPTERVATGERPHSYKIATVVELPFGKGRRFLSNAPGWLDAIAGGWRFSANYLWQAGSTMSWDNRYYDPTRNPQDLKTTFGKNEQGQRYGIDVPAWDLSGFYFPDKVTRAEQIADDRIKINSNRYKRSFPETIDGMRNPAYHNLDLGLAKTFDLRRAKLQLRVEVINAENYAELTFEDNSRNPESGTFGFLTGQRTLPRDIQVGARLTF